MNAKFPDWIFFIQYRCLDIIEAYEDFLVDLTIADYMSLLIYVKKKRFSFV
jgi:hypothetical protein